jgi:hypothetical protein
MGVLGSFGNNATSKIPSTTTVRKIDYERMPGCFLGLMDERLLSISDPNYTTQFIVSSLKTAMTLCTTERNIRLQKDLSTRCFTLLLIRKKNNLKNTLTKRRKNGDVHNDSYNNCSRRYDELCSQLTKLKLQEKRKLNHRRFENPKTGRKTWMDLNNVLGNHRKPDQPIELLSDYEVLVKEKVRIADTFNWRGTGCRT